MSRAAYWRRIGTPPREARLALIVENGIATLVAVVLIALPFVLADIGWLKG